MSSKNDDLYVDDELTAAFVDDENMDVSGGDGADNNQPTRDWIENSNAEIDGQLPIDVYETKQQLIVKCRVAGVDRGSLDVSLADNMLTIRGVSSAQITETVDNYLVQECYWGEFTRSVGLPVPVKEDEIDAFLKDGILTISFAKIKQDTVKKIDVK